MAVTASDQDVPAELRIEYRIGVNLGDVIVDDDDLYQGDIAAGDRSRNFATIAKWLILGAISYSFTAPVIEAT